MKTKPACDFYILEVTDSRGTKDTVMTEDFDHNIWVSGFTAEGRWVQFHDHADTLLEWANYYGFAYRRLGYNFSDLGEPAEVHDD